jgi:structural maintenance of chromosome 1
MIPSVLTLREGLRQLEESLRGQLAELTKNRPRNSADEVLTSEISRLETELAVAKDDLAATKARLNGARSELPTLDKKIQGLSSQVDAATTERDTLAQSIATFTKIIEAAEGDIFADFCRRVGIKNIKEYEASALVQDQQETETNLKFQKQISRLTHQIEFERDQLDTIESRLQSLVTMGDKEKTNLATSRQELETTRAELSEIEEELESMREELKALEDAVLERQQAAETIRKSSGKSSTAFTKAQKEISDWVRLF